MRITALKQQVKKPDRVSVFVDSKYSFSLTMDQLLEQKLKKDQELDELQVKRFKKLSEEGKLRARALEWVMSRPHSERELRDYLFRKQAEKEQIEALVGEFYEKKYVDDEQFTRWFAENRAHKHKSARAITAELRSKGISPVTIQNIVTELGIADQETESIVILVNKLRKRPRYQDDQKLKSYLVSKGFSYSDIKQAMQDNSPEE